MRDVDLDNGNDDWKNYTIPTFNSVGGCLDWVPTRNGISGFVYVSGVGKCFVKTGDVKIKPVPLGVKSYGGVLPCP